MALSFTRLRGVSVLIGRCTSQQVHNICAVGAFWVLFWFGIMCWCEGQTVGVCASVWWVKITNQAHCWLTKWPKLFRWVQKLLSDITVLRFIQSAGPQQQNMKTQFNITSGYSFNIFPDLWVEVGNYVTVAVLEQFDSEPVKTQLFKNECIWCFQCVPDPWPLPFPVLCLMFLNLSLFWLLSNKKNKNQMTRCHHVDIKSRISCFLRPYEDSSCSAWEKQLAAVLVAPFYALRPLKDFLILLLYQIIIVMIIIVKMIKYTIFANLADTLSFELFNNVFIYLFLNKQKTQIKQPKINKF